MTIIHDDLVERSVNIHWPDGFDPGNADLFAQNAVVIDAPAGTIWAKLIDAAAWPTWYSNASDPTTPSRPLANSGGEVQRREAIEDPADRPPVFDLARAGIRHLWRRSLSCCVSVGGD